MQRIPHRRGAVVLAAVLAVYGANAAAQTAETRDDRPRLQAHRLQQPPVIDGEVLDEALWQQVEAATGFQQTQPFEGQPASELTEVRIAFDDHNLYIAAICFDREASTLVISDSRRDASLSSEDSFPPRPRHLWRPAETPSCSAPTSAAFSTTARSPTRAAAAVDRSRRGRVRVPTWTGTPPGP